MESQSEWKQNAATWKQRYPTSDMQAEFFLLKFSVEGVTREEVFELLKQFQQFDMSQQGELEEAEAMRLLEARGNVKTFVELRKMVEDIDLDKNRKLSFLEWACAIFDKSWKKLHSPSVDPEEVRKATELQEKCKAEFEKIQRHKEEKAAEDARAQANMSEKMKEKEEAERRKHLLEENLRKKKEDQDRKAREEEETKQAALSQSGVKGRAAMFHYAAKDTQDTTADSAARLKAEAAARKEKARLEAEKKVKEEEARVAAEEAAKAAAIREEAERLAAEEAERKREADEARAKAEAGSEVARRELEEYQRRKASADEHARQKAEEEAAKRAESRKRLAEKAAAFAAK